MLIMYHFFKQATHRLMIKIVNWSFTEKPKLTISKIHNVYFHVEEVDDPTVCYQTRNVSI